MITRATSWLAWSIDLMSVALLSASTVLLVLNRPTRVVESAGVWGTANLPFIFLVVTLVGALVASRRPTNPIGWISLAAGLALALFTPGVGIANPFGIDAAREVLELLGTIGFFLLPLCIVASAVGVVGGLEVCPGLFMAPERFG
jgi:hypothetical protein